MTQLVIDERIHDTANITGTGDYVVQGAPTGKQAASVIGAGNYSALFITDDINWEAGLYTYQSGPGRMVRTHVVKSSAGGSAINWNNADVKIKCGWPAWLTAPRAVSKSVAGSSNVALTALEQACDQLELTGALTGNINVTVDDTKWAWTVKNGTTGNYTITLKTAGGAGIILPQGQSTIAYCNGVDVVHALSALLPAGQGYVPIGESAGAPVSMPFPMAGAKVINGKIALSVNASALTAALKGLDGNNPSPSNPVFVLMPQGNPFDGTYAVRKVTAALSVVVSSGSTLGHTSAVACPVYVYLIDNAGVLELAVSTKFFGGIGVVSTTAEGGAGAADTATTMYSTTARSNVPAACLMRWKSTQTTAGTWAAVTGEVQLYPFPYKKPSVQSFTAGGTYTRPWDLLWARIKVKGGGASGGGSSTTYGGGGGEGETAWKLVDAAAIAASETVTIGAGGAAIALNTNSDGNNGGTTSFGSHVTATGGLGGKSGNTTGAGGLGGASGTGSDWKEAGAVGHTGLLATVGGILSPGGGRGAGLFATAAATNSGAGGGGGSAGSASGAGGAGICVVEEFYGEGS